MTTALDLAQLFAEHLRDQLQFGNSLDFPGFDGLTITHNRNAVADYEQFIQAMGDKDGGDLVRLQPAVDFEEMFTSCSSSDDVGSSMTTSLYWKETPRAMATICWIAMLYSISG